MKNGIHPEYFETQVSCGCGNKFTTRSTRKELKVDICNVCHPFYTGKLKFVDTAGRIEKFKNKFAAAGYASLGKGKKKRSGAPLPRIPSSATLSRRRCGCVRPSAAGVAASPTAG